MTSQPDTEPVDTTPVDTDTADVGVGEEIIATVANLLRNIADRHRTTLDPALVQEMAGAAAAVMLIEMASREALASTLSGTRIQRMQRHIAATLLFQDAAAEVLTWLRAQNASERENEPGGEHVP